MKIKNKITISVLLTALIIISTPVVSAHLGETQACNKPGQCHAYPPIISINVTTDVTALTVNPGQSFTVNATWSGGLAETGTVAAWPTDFSVIGIVINNTQFNPTPNISTTGFSGTLLSVLTAPNTPGAHTLRVYAATRIGEIRETDFKNISVIVQGAQQNGSIAGMKFNDTNNNSVKDAGETGLPGWIINLAKPDGGTATTATDANGGYNFTSLPAGTYTVSEVVQAGWRQTFPPTGNYTVNLAAGQNVVDRDFGNFKLPPVDTTPPAATITSPVNGSITNTSTATVSGTATDDVGVTSVTVNGVPATITPGVAVTFSTTVTLVNGTNTITVAASDAAGNSGTATAIVTFTPPDGAVTNITITPAVVNITAASNTTFTATARDQNSNPIAGIIISWTVSNTTVGNVAQVSSTTDASGNATTIFTGSVYGTAIITATNGTVSGTAKVRVCRLTPPVAAYDFNTDDTIQRDEAVAAVVDFFAGSIPRQQAVEVVVTFFG